MPKALDLVGKRFNRLFVEERVNDPRQGSFWLCLCDCGERKVIRGDALRSGRAQSCGCRARQLFAEQNTKHGRARSIEFRTWHNIKQRCQNPGAASYKYYGGRGIKVCERWLASFEAFYEDMGPRPSPHHSIDRIDVDGDYEPGNCRWATAKQQVDNRRMNKAA